MFRAFGYEPQQDESGEAVWQFDGKLDFEGHRADYHVVNGNGVILRPTGSTFTVEGQEVPEMAPVPGYHVNIRWLGPVEMIPDFGPARFAPEPATPECRFSARPS